MHDRLATAVFSGGGTGGHLYPALALADALRRERPDVRVVFLGARRGLEARVLPERGEEHRLLPIRGVARGGGIRTNFGVPWALLRSVAGTIAWFRDLHPELVVVTGGYAGAPAGMAAVLMGIPLALQEQNAYPGVTTRLLSRWARQVHLAYPEALQRLPAGARARARITGNPVRPPGPQGRGGARSDLGLDPEVPTVLVVGGSQGSVALNRAVVDMVRALPSDPGFQLLWSTGPSHEAMVAKEVGTEVPWVHITGYVTDMPVALEAADVAVSRAGAMATSEFLAWGLPAVLVPLPSAAADHQTQNAQALADAGCAVHLPESDLTGAVLREAVLGIMADTHRRESMSAAARNRARPNAARVIARELLALLRQGREANS